MKTKIISYQLMITMAVCMILFLLGFSKTFYYSVFISSFLSCVNLVLLIWGYELLFFKKSVALGIGVIVSKWLIFVLTLYKMLQIPEVKSSAVALGIGLFFPVLMVVGYLKHKDKIQNKN
ncbi:MAG: hypothetical protein KDD50_00900 [Bdellovibrionales bacterium]|nr:hypothetical protein [Bdellovibrionales bacterium]